MENFNTTNLNFTYTSVNSNSVPSWIINLYFIFIVLGVILNSLHLYALLKSTLNGTFSIILQLCVIDILQVYVIIIETQSLQNNSWTFSTKNCPVFKGTKVLTNFLSIYSIICLNFHLTSLWNLHRWNSNKNPLTSCEADESNECLVTKSENANRTVTIDYRKHKNDVAIFIPIVMVWLISASLSVPNFVFSSAVKLNEQETVCAIVDRNQALSHLLLSTFKVVTPLVLLIFSFGIVLIKLAQTSQKEIANVLTKKFNEIRDLLIFACILTGLYCITSLQHQIFSLIDQINYRFFGNINNIELKIEYDSNYLNPSTRIYLTMLHYCSVFVRPVFYIYYLPKFPHVFEVCVGHKV